MVGYDDDENVAPWLVPTLTTVRLPHREMGERAMRVVLAGVRDDVAPHRCGAELAGRPVLRTSVAWYVPARPPR